MSPELSETRIALNQMMPENCDCSEINGLAAAYARAVNAGEMTHDEALSGFEETIDPACQGKELRQEVDGELSCFADGCCVPNKVCKNGRYLIAMTMKVRTDTAT